MPDADFAKRVVALLKPVSRQAADVWEYIPAFARPIVAVTMVALVVIIGLQMMYPQMPDQGIVDAHLAEDSTPTDAWLYQDAEIPEGDDLLLGDDPGGGVAMTRTLQAKLLVLAVFVAGTARRRRYYQCLRRASSGR